MSKLHIRDSSMIAGANYDPNHKVLALTYKSGDVYQYRRVPPVVVEGLLTAESPGHYVNENIKDTFPYRQLDLTKGRPVGRWRY